MCLFEAKDLTKKYDKTVLNHLDFSIDEGEVVGIIGVSGCGKSTLARLVSGKKTFFRFFIISRKNS